MISTIQTSKFNAQSHLIDEDETFDFAAAHRHRRFKLQPLDHVNHFGTQENRAVNSANNKPCIDPLNDPRLAGEISPRKQQTVVHYRQNRHLLEAMQYHQRHSNSNAMGVLLNKAARRIQRFVRAKLRERKQKRADKQKRAEKLKGAEFVGLGAFGRQSSTSKRMPFINLHRGAGRNRPKRPSKRASSARVRASSAQVRRLAAANGKMLFRKPNRTPKMGARRYVIRGKPALSLTTAATIITRFFKRFVRCDRTKKSTQKIKRPIPRRYVAHHAALARRPRRHSHSQHAEEVSPISAKPHRSPRHSQRATTASPNTTRPRRSRCRGIPTMRTQRQRQHDQMCAAATLISCTWRGALCRQHYAHTLQRRRLASFTLSKHWRGVLCRRRYSYQLTRTRAALLAITRRWRGVMARRTYAKMLQARRARREQAATDISRQWRAAQARSHVGCMRYVRRRHVAATIIAKHCRGMLRRCKFRQWRAAQARSRRMRYVRRRHAAATLIAKHWRGMLGRCKFRWKKHVESRLREECASRLIQIVYKLWRLRNRPSQHTRHIKKAQQKTRHTKKAQQKTRHTKRFQQKTRHTKKAQQKTWSKKTKRGGGNGSGGAVSSKGRVQFQSPRAGWNNRRGGGSARRSRDKSVSGGASSKDRVEYQSPRAGHHRRGRDKSVSGGASSKGRTEYQSPRAGRHPYWNKHRSENSSQGSGQTIAAHASGAGGASLVYGRSHVKRQRSRGGMFTTTHTVTTRHHAGDDDGDDKYECFASFEGF